MQMNDAKERRRQTIAELIRRGALASQDELGERLADLGFAVTQATISRDLEQIGAVKVRRAGQLGYALPDQVAPTGAPRLAAVLGDFARSIETASNLVVIKTPPGSAHLIGVALDQSDLSEIVGTICGDDTVFVACASALAATKLRAKLDSARLRLGSERR